MFYIIFVPEGTRGGDISYPYLHSVKDLKSFEFALEQKYMLQLAFYFHLFVF